MDFENRVVLVTGASRNIGRAIALAFAHEGADVAVNAATRAAEAEQVAEEIRGMGRRAVACVADITSAVAVGAMADQVREQLGAVDILVLNAAIRPESPILEMSYEEWRRVLDISLDGAFHCTRAFLPTMLERGWGRIITLGGLTSQRGGPNRAHVAAAKGGLQGFTRALAVELGRTGVTVNMVAPGSIRTSRATGEMEGRFSAMGQAAPVGRQGLPEEIAAACLYLASPAAAYVTGQTLNVNGGVVLS